MMRCPTLPAWLKGILIGQLAWAALALELEFQFGQKLEKLLPTWLRSLDVIDAIETPLMVLAAPVTLGGWLFLWGDNGPPYPWIEGWPFVIAFGLGFYGVLGAIAGQFGPKIWSKLRSRFSLRTLIIAMTLAAAVFGLIVHAAA
jgi:hypothetical protein